MANNRMEHNCGTRTARAAFRVACGLRSEELGSAAGFADTTGVAA